MGFQKIKNKEVRGFSIEGWFTDKIIEASKQKKDIIDESNNLDEVTLNKIRKIILEEELNPIGSLDGEPLFRTKEEADLYAEMFKSCGGSHIHIMDGEEFHMACVDHSTAVNKEELDKKKKKKKHQYSSLEQISFAKKKALAKYSWDECIADQMKEYGNEETAAKVCSAIKNKTVKR